MNWRNPLWPIREVEWFVQIVGQHTDHLAKTQGDNRQVITAQAQDGQPKCNPSHPGDKDRPQQEKPEEATRIGKGRQDRKGPGDLIQMPDLLRTKEGPQVGADGIEGNVTQIEQASKADHDIEPQGQRTERADLKANFQQERVTYPKNGYDDH